jgi:hypothetical protein
LLSGTSYSYRVRATDAAANLSAYSNSQSDDHECGGHDATDGANWRW